jgi:hypothetical protein
MGRRKLPPADTPQGREDQLISLAYDLVEQRLLDGSATAQETVTFIKMGSERERLERERIQKDNLLLSAKVDQIASAKKVEGLVEGAIAAFKRYSGTEEEVEEEDGYLYDSY